MNILSVDKSEIAENTKANLIVYKTLLQGGILEKLVAAAKNVRDLQKQLVKEGKEKDLLELLEGEYKASAVLVELAKCSIKTFYRVNTLVSKKIRFNFSSRKTSNCTRTYLRYCRLLRYLLMKSPKPKLHGRH
jgi:hypothetical protein